LDGPSHPTAGGDASLSTVATEVVTEVAAVASDGPSLPTAGGVASLSTVSTEVVTVGAAGDTTMATPEGAVLPA
jgi:hypothetical protein